MKKGVDGSTVSHPTHDLGAESVGYLVVHYGDVAPGDEVWVAKWPHAGDQVEFERAVATDDLQVGSDPLETP